jgi:MFS family permease
LTLSALSLFGLKEVLPREPAAAERRPLMQALREVWGGDARFRRFVVVRVFYELGFSAMAFYAIYGAEKFGLSLEVAGPYALAWAVGAAVIAPPMGRIGDRRGYRRVLGWATGAMTVTTVVALVSWEPWVMYGVLGLMGVAKAADGSGFINMLVEMGTEETRGYYRAVVESVVLPVRLLAPPLLGWLGDGYGLEWSLGLCLAAQVTSFVLLLVLIDDPRRPGQRLLRWEAVTRRLQRGTRA